LLEKKWKQKKEDEVDQTHAEDDNEKIHNVYFIAFF